MALRKSWLTEKNVAEVLRIYREPACLNKQEIAVKLGTTPHTVGWIIRNKMPPEEHHALKVLRYSKSKTGTKNPMFGKTEKAHHRWIGEVDDGYGYLTCMYKGKRQFVHRIVMAKVLGLPELPSKLDVHHIDNDPKNNQLDNLALVSRRGHRLIHSLQRTDSKGLALKKSTVWEAYRYMTSR